MTKKKGLGSIFLEGATWKTEEVRQIMRQFTAVNISH